MSSAESVRIMGKLSEYLDVKITRDDVSRWALEFSSDLPNFIEAPLDSAAATFFVDKLYEEGSNTDMSEVEYRGLVHRIRDVLMGLDTWIEELHYRGDLLGSSSHEKTTVIGKVAEHCGMALTDFKGAFHCSFTVELSGETLTIRDARIEEA